MGEATGRAHVCAIDYGVGKLGGRCNLTFFNYPLSVKDTKGKLTFLTLKFVSENLNHLKVSALKYQRRLSPCRACQNAGSLHFGQLLDCKEHNDTIFD
jgi:hypothetical protein